MDDEEFPSGLVAGDEAEAVDVLVQFLERKFERRFLAFQVVQAETGEIGHQQVAWQLGVAQAVEVVAGLGVGAVQVLAAGLVLDQQHTLPEQVNVAILAIELLDPLLEAGDALAADAEDVEELVPEGLGLGILRGHIGPFLREAQGPILDLVPAQRHGGCPVWRWKDWLSIPTPVSAGATVADKARP